MYEFSNFSAESDNVALWSLQQFLLSEAEKLFGVKNFDTVICQPIFNGNRPTIMNGEKCAYASLSNNSRTFWPTTLYELAHETVHLLNPVVGSTNYLEEGFAVLFSIDMSRTYTNNPQSPVCPVYLEAFNLVTKLDENPYFAAKLIRGTFSSLGTANINGMSNLFPAVSQETINKLCEECNFT